ncbi:PREDICTED: atherin-like [Priapulus caudatus]|uniref:Atherin-like n=1 Tax=Priapulus caudatus TaxID=37621 RepID=A0ABM1EKD6_PRICU|nr:PREDICTED: atherin-like [Priapulus caudatus]
MLFCDACDKGYHMKCHTPKVAKKPTGKWVCFKCEHDGVRDPADNGTSEAETASQDSSLGGVDGLDGASCLPTPCDSPVNGEPMNMYATAIKTDEMLNKVGECHPGSDEIPDASDWAIEEVVNYFIDVGFLDQAAAFREQEIDGKSLLLMKRSDVLTGLNLKLGPALKIYSHVRRLQIRENSPSDFLL